jgi:hypothetical protein
MVSLTLTVAAGFASNLSSLLSKSSQENKLDTFRKIHVAELAALADKNSKVVVLDAARPDVRTKYGVVPGARVLSSYDHYDLATELPAAKNAKLVFYCANTL